MTEKKPMLDPLYNFWTSLLVLSTSHKVKNNCCLFVRLFKVKKNDIFFFGIPLFILEIFMFLYYANKESDDIMDSPTKQLNAESRISPEI